MRTLSPLSPLKVPLVPSALPAPPGRPLSKSFGSTPPVITGASITPSLVPLMVTLSAVEAVPSCEVTVNESGSIWPELSA